MGHTVVKWGNSLALRIPAAIARQMEISEGSELEIRLDGKRLVIERADSLPEFSSDDLARALATTSPALVELGPPRGRESI
jgi:antitoxin MazE